MKMAHALVVGFAAVVAGLMATGEARAQADMSEQEMLDHANALAIFERSCVKAAPGFETSADGFRAGGLELTDAGFWIDKDEKLRAVVNQTAKKCVVGLDDASIDYFVEGLRGVMTNAWNGNSYREIPSGADFPPHLFVWLDQDSMKQFTVAVKPLEGIGTVTLEYGVSDPFASQ